MSSVLAVMSLFQYVEPRITAYWCRSPRGKNDARFRRRMRWALSPRKWTMAVPLLFGLLNPFYLLAILGGSAAEFALTCFAVYIATCLVAYPFYLRKALRAFRQKLATEAVRKLVRIADNQFAEELIIAAAQSSEPVLRVVACEGLRLMGTPACNQALDKLCGDRNMQVSLAACYAAKDLAKVLSGKHIESLAALEPLLKEYQLATTYFQRKEDGTVGQDEPRIRKAEREIDKIVYSQLLLRRAFPDVYCEKCHVFGEMQAFHDWRWVSCPVCKDAIDLKSGIAKAIGTIGAATPWLLEGNVLKVSVWDTENRRVIPAAISALEVVGLKDIDYDWALSAVLEMLRNRRIEGSAAIPIRLEHSPPLSVNSRNLIRDFVGAGRA